MKKRLFCPVCQCEKATFLFHVPTDVFAYNNETFDLLALKSSGLLDLPTIKLMECAQCSTVYCSSVLDDKWNNIFWSEVYIPEKSKKKILRKSKRLNNLNRWIQMYSFLLEYVLEDGEILNLLDYGCGWADFLMVARSPGVRVIGIEVNKDKAAFASENGIEIYPSLNDIPDDIQFKAFHSDQVIEHLVNPVEVMEKIVSRLHPDFLGYIGVPNYSKDKILSIKQKLDHGEKVLDKDLVTWDHINYFSPEALSFFLAKLQFSPIELPSGNLIKELTSTNSFIRFKNKAFENKQETKPFSNKIRKFFSKI